MIEAAARTILANNADVQKLVGNRITFGIAAQGENKPRVVLTLVDSSHEHTFTGHAGYVTGRIQCDCLAPTYPVAKSLAKAIIAALDGYEGKVTGIAGINVSYIAVDSESDVPTAVPEGAAIPSTFGVSVDFTFMYTTA